ncbi:MAG: hypothetical protein H6712_17860 [Myxococcales bacterium]|nr:hypothetical protein [Myxococcales bacterium]
MKLALALVLSLPSTWATAGPTEAPPTTEIYLDLMVQADKATSRGNHREAANLCNLAFRSRPQSHWADTTSIVIIHKAIASYEAAVTELGEDIGQLRTRADLLRAESGLLHDFVVAAHRTQEIPPQIAQAAVVLWPQIDELDARIAAFEEEQARIRRQDEEIRREIINDETEQAPLEKEIEAPPSQRAKAGPVLVGVGVPVFTGGAALATIGAWMFTEVPQRSAAYERLGEEALAHASESNRGGAQIELEEQRVATFYRQLGRYDARSRANAMLFAVGGGALMAAGLALTITGATYIRHPNKRSDRRLALVPMAGRARGARIVISF